MTEKTTVVLVDDHPVFLKGLRMLLEDEPDFAVIGEADSGEQAIAVITELQPEIVVLDISMPDFSGIEVAEQLSVSYPKIKIIALSIHSEKRFVEDMLVAGAAGYILKQTAPEDLVNGIRTIMHGEAFLSPSITSVVLSGFKTRYGSRKKGLENQQIIGTKLIPTPIPENYIERKELAAKLDKGSRLPVTLITAAAGYGKSTTVSHWLQQQSVPYGWISLDETDSEPRQFLGYLVHVVQSLFPGTLPETETLVSSSRLPSMQAIAATLLRELGHIAENGIVVLDNAHLIRHQGFSEFLSELLRHPPQQLHLLIMGRRDPDLPIALLRGRRVLAELRAGDLQFSLEETREYLWLALGEATSGGLATLLQEKMEGWVAGLRLAIISSEQTAGLEQTLNQLNGDSQFVQEYLSAEAFATLVPGLHTNTVKLAVLDKFCGPLCEALVGTVIDDEKQISGWDFVNELCQSNLFMVSLDSESIWYRFHHLFRQLLMRQLQRSHTAGEIEGLHTAASNWFVSNGLYQEGIEHAILGGDITGAEQIVLQYRYNEMGRDRWKNLERWLEPFPEEQRLTRPVLILSYAWVCCKSYRLQELAALLNRFMEIGAEIPLEDSWLAESRILWGILSYWRGDSNSALQHLAAATDIVTENNPLLFGLIDMYMALARQMEGETERAQEQIRDRELNMGIQPAIFRSQIIASRCFLHLIDGSLHRASEAAERLWLVSAANDLPYTRGWGPYLLGNIYLQSFSLEEAADQFQLLTDSVDVMHSRAAVDGLAGMALTRFFQQRLREIPTILTRLKELTSGSRGLHLATVVHSLEGHLALLRGDESGMRKCLQLMGQPFPDPALFSWIESPEITQLRIWIRIGSATELDSAVELIAALKGRVVATHNNYQLLDIMALETLLLLKTQGVDRALPFLSKTLTHAARDGWVRPFIEAGRPLMELLNRLKPDTEEVRHHITLIQRIFSLGSLQIIEKTSEPPQALPEPLTSREAQILELLAQRLRNKEIGDRLFISTETVKSHIKRLFSKLDAANRRDVVDKARDLGLL